jgi:hypothetical protein
MDANKTLQQMIDCLGKILQGESRTHGEGDRRKTRISVRPNQKRNRRREPRPDLRE